MMNRRMDPTSCPLNSTSTLLRVFTRTHAHAHLKCLLTHSWNVYTFLNSLPTCKHRFKMRDQLVLQGALPAPPWGSLGSFILPLQTCLALCVLCFKPTDFSPSSRRQKRDQMVVKEELSPVTPTGSQLWWFTSHGGISCPLPLISALGSKDSSPSSQPLAPRHSIPKICG